MKTPANPQQVFRARQRSAQDDITRLCTKLAEMQELQPTQAEQLQGAILALKALQDELKILEREEYHQC